MSVVAWRSACSAASKKGRQASVTWSTVTWPSGTLRARSRRRKSRRVGLELRREVEWRKGKAGGKKSSTIVSPALGVRQNKEQHGMRRPYQAPLPSCQGWHRCRPPPWARPSPWLASGAQWADRCAAAQQAPGAGTTWRRAPHTWSSLAAESCSKGRPMSVTVATTWRSRRCSPSSIRAANVLDAWQVIDGAGHHGIGVGRLQGFGRCQRPRQLIH